MHVLRCLFVAAALTLAGCGKAPPQTASGPETPLSLEEWQNMAPHEKYEPDTLGRLKRSNPHLHVR